MEEKLIEIRDTLIDKAEMQLDCLEYINTMEMGAVIDMIKDIDEALMYRAKIKKLELEITTV